jgi:hypothetical protein
MIMPDLPTLTNALATWLPIVIKALAAAGFMAVGDVVILYAC